MDRWLILAVVVMAFVVTLFWPLVPLMIKGATGGWKRRVIWEHVRSQPHRATAPAARIITRQPTHPKRRAFASGAGFVYLAKSGDFYKIGLAVNVEERLKALRTSSPYPIALLHTIRTPNMRRLEMTLHRAYAHKRAQGEWFALELADVATIRAIPDTITERDLALLETL